LHRSFQLYVLLLASPRGPRVPSVQEFSVGKACKVRQDLDQVTAGHSDWAPSCRNVACASRRKRLKRKLQIESIAGIGLIV